MKARRLEEIFEECLAAFLEKGRSVEESLSLYPALAPQLEPLLRTAVGLNHAFEANGPPWHAVERGRNKFLAAARTRATGRALMRDTHPRISMPWGRGQWMVLGGAVAAALAVVAVTSATLMGGSGSDGNGDVVSGGGSPTARPVPTVVENLIDGFDRITDRGTPNATVTSEVVDDLKALAAEIQADPSTLEGLGDADRQEVAAGLQEGVDDLKALPPEEKDEGVIGLLSLLEEMLAQLSTTPTPTEDTPAPTTPADTPAPTPTPVETEGPTPEPTEAPTPPDSGGETPAPTQDTAAGQPTPQPTPVFRLFGS